MRKRIGKGEWIKIQRTDGKFEEWYMYPLLDEFGGWVRWLTVAEAYAYLDAA